MPENKKAMNTAVYECSMDIMIMLSNRIPGLKYSITLRKQIATIIDTTTGLSDIQAALRELVEASIEYEAATTDFNRGVINSEKFHEIADRQVAAIAKAKELL